MKYRYTLPSEWIRVVAQMHEFAPGGTQVTVVTKDGAEHRQILISNCQWITAARGHKDLPFKIEDIGDLYQRLEDAAPPERGGWERWDDFQPKLRKRS